MAIAALLFGIVGLAVSLLPLVRGVALGLGPFVSLCGGGIAVVGLVLALATIVIARVPAEGRRRRLLRAALLAGFAGVLASLAVARHIVGIEESDEAAEARAPMRRIPQRVEAPLPEGGKMEKRP